jgi:transposase
MMTGEAAERDRDGVSVGLAGATRGYLCPARDQLFLMPVSMRDWLAQGHLAWFVVDVVGRLDTRGLHRRPGGCAGRPPYQPEMMVAVLLYGYCCGIRSSRRIEAQCRTDAAFRVICGGLVPDHATIARFVVEHERALEGLFVEGLRLCAAAGLADLSVVALDGTKIAADASRARNRDGVWIRGEVTKLMAVTAENEPVAGGADGLPGLEPVAEISSSAGRLARLQAALEVLEAEDAAVTAQAARRADAAAVEAEQGRQITGRKPRHPVAALVRAEADHLFASERLQSMQAARAAKLEAAARGETLTAAPPSRIQKAKDALTRAEVRLATARTTAAQTTPETVTARRVNITDPDSRMMTTKDGWVQGYNAQAIVNPHQIVLACEVSQHVGDVQLYEPMNERLTQTLTAAGITARVELELADAGYCSIANLTCPGPDRLIATQKDHKQRRAARELGQTNGPPPDGTPIQEMEHLLRTPQGAAAYKQRSSLIEPVFGDHKHNRGTRRFRRRGLDAVRSEWAFIHLAGNMLKLYQHQATAA